MLGATIFLAGGAGVWAIVTDLTTVRVVETPVAVHADQEELNEMIEAGDREEAFEEAFELGDELFATSFNALDGGGANVGDGQRYTRIPRADQRGEGEWFNHRPIRNTGPNAAACADCHNLPFEDGGGPAVANVHRDAFRTAIVAQFVQRNTPHFFASGAIQRLAEEMTVDLHALRTRVRDRACQMGGTQTVTLITKTVNFGTLSATRTSPTSNPCTVTFNTDGVRGVDFQPPPDNPNADPDLVVRPFQWKGSVGFLRDFNRGASHNEIGMQAIEVVGEGVDGDFDGVVDEMTVGDQTTLAVYIAAQPRPTTLTELASLDLIEPLPAAQVAAINRGATVFREVGCATCHIPRLTINRPIFSEPSQEPAYRDGRFPAGQDPVAMGLSPRTAITFDLTRDQPDNRIDRGGGRIFRLGSLRRDKSGRALVELLGDMKRHEMGPRLAEPVNEIAGDDVTPIPVNPRNRHTPSAFLTEALWGAGSTPPYMHDGRATTITEAILEHGNGRPDDISEAAASRRAFLARSANDKRALVAFVNNQVLFKVEEEEEEAKAVVPEGIKVKPFKIFRGSNSEVVGEDVPAPEEVEP